jgi:hypothetical protein
VFIARRTVFSEQLSSAAIWRTVKSVRQSSAYFAIREDGVLRIEGMGLVKASSFCQEELW